MSEVNRYDCVTEYDGGIMIDSPTGEYIEFADYAALQEQLAQRDAQIAALTAENVALKDAVKTHSVSVHFCEICGKDDPCETDDVCLVLKEVPATDAAANALRADGVDRYIESVLNSNREIAEKGGFSDAVKVFEHLAKEASGFASQLREGK